MKCSQRLARQKESTRVLGTHSQTQLDVQSFRAISACGELDIPPPTVGQIITALETLFISLIAISSDIARTNSPLGDSNRANARFLVRPPLQVALKTINTTVRTMRLLEESLIAQTYCFIP